MATESQIEANKQNAQLSTGPKDTSKTNKNAIKFGIFTKETIVNCKYYHESFDEFRSVLNDFLEEYNPENITERILVEEAVDAYWRLKRVRKARKAQITIDLESSEYEADHEKDWNDMTRQVLCKMSYAPYRWQTHEQIEKRFKAIQDKEKKFYCNEMSEQEMEEIINSMWGYDGDEELDIPNLPLERKRELVEEAFETERNFWEEPFMKKVGEKKALEKLKKEVNLSLLHENLSTYESILEKKFYRAVMSLRQLKIKVL